MTVLLNVIVQHKVSAMLYHMECLHVLMKMSMKSFVMRQLMHKEMDVALMINTVEEKEFVMVEFVEKLTQLVIQEKKEMSVMKN